MKLRFGQFFIFEFRTTFHQLHANFF
jgi:hypothetical protein